MVLLKEEEEVMDVVQAVTVTATVTNAEPETIEEPVVVDSVCKLYNIFLNKIIKHTVIKRVNQF